jgi:hypothetical protein
VKDEEGQEQVKRKVVRSKKEEVREATNIFLPFALLLSSSLILYPSSFAFPSFILLNTPPPHLPKRAGFPAGS